MGSAKEKEIEASRDREESPPVYDPTGEPVVVLEFRRHGEHETLVADATTKQVFYTIKRVETHYWRGHHIGYFRGGPDKNGGMSQKPYAITKTSTLAFDETVPTEFAGMSDAKKSRFLYSGGFLKTANKFKVGQQEYRLKSRTWKNSDLNLVISTPSSDGPKTVLATFAPKSKWGGFGKADIKGTLTIFPAAIGDSSSGYFNPHALILDGHPTPLLDLAFIAEAVKRYNEKQESAGAAASSAAASSSAGAGAAC